MGTYWKWAHSANFHPILSLLASLRPNTDPLGFANTENDVQNKDHKHSPCTGYLTYSSKLAVNNELSKVREKVSGIRRTPGCLWVVARPRTACTSHAHGPGSILRTKTLLTAPQTHTYPESHTITKVLGQPTLNSADAWNTVYIKLDVLKNCFVDFNTNFLQLIWKMANYF